ncbi:serine--tRNA ligase [Wenxinia marina]|uniref:Serine--tRNA ligase n=1 Tax=Wenxinia marina DSM 24838 TaxID=1123501 RepID=A0A0D0Q939_9RHOB|nr:serine--tRNA ligase [Wenxinia marina]KIQ68892.1 seryl-tRNA synthetase [Wenxinia marina DSM 24838]GGL64377.1 serine--tRNA ligase [Wenxinia marina]
MHDIRQIRDNPAAFDAALSSRGMAPMSPAILALDEERRGLIHKAETLRAAQNRASKEIGAAKAAGDEDRFQRLRAEVAEHKEEGQRLADAAKAKDDELQALLLTIPNLPYDDVPVGADEDSNVELSRWGAPRNFSFDPREHYEIPAVKDQLDFEAAAMLSGSRFVVLRSAAARLHRALAQFMLDHHVEQNGLEETITPVLVKPEMMLGTGQLPKFGEDSYQTTTGWWLIPTAEVTLTNMVHGQIVDAARLPWRMVAHTNCFRSEAGSAGRDTAGMLRQHQFEKVEMVTICTPDQSEAEHERMTRCAASVLEALELPYRVMKLSTGDMGGGARRTHDLEVWLPGQNTYREISSVSTCGDWQARRMNGRYRPADGGKPEYVHTLNGSGLAVGRALIAVLENGQEEDGSVTLPEALHPYLRGATRITAEGRLE